MKTVQCRIRICHTNLQSDVEVELFSLSCLSERGVCVWCWFDATEQKNAAWLV